MLEPLEKAKVLHYYVVFVLVSSPGDFCSKLGLFLDNPSLTIVAATCYPAFPTPVLRRLSKLLLFG